MHISHFFGWSMGLVKEDLRIVLFVEDWDSGLEHLGSLPFQRWDNEDRMENLHLQMKDKIWLVDLWPRLYLTFI